MLNLTRRAGLAFLLCLVTWVQAFGWTLLQSPHAQSTGGTTSTTAVDTTNADLIVIMVSDFSGGSVPTDSASNTWTKAISVTTTRQTPTIYFVHNPTTSTTHTFTGQGTHGFIEVQAWSGSATGTILDQTGTGLSGALGSTTVSASATPTTNNQLIVLGSSSDDPANAGGTPFSVNSPFTLDTFDNGVPGNLFGATFSYFTQTTAAAETGTVTRSSAGTNSANQDGALIATFKGAAVASANLRTLIGVGR